MKLRVPSIPRSGAAWKAAISTGDAETKSSQWINADLAPTPQDKRTWSWQVTAPAHPNSSRPL